MRLRGQWLLLRNFEDGFGLKLRSGMRETVDGEGVCDVGIPGTNNYHMGIMVWDGWLWVWIRAACR